LQWVVATAKKRQENKSNDTYNGDKWTNSMKKIERDES
jgi:hypothetical protein